MSMNTSAGSFMAATKWSCTFCKSNRSWALSSPDILIKSQSGEQYRRGNFKLAINWIATNRDLCYSPLLFCLCVLLSFHFSWMKSQENCQLSSCWRFNGVRSIEIHCVFVLTWLNEFIFSFVKIFYWKFKFMFSHHQFNKQINEYA